MQWLSEKKHRARTASASPDIWSGTFQYKTEVLLLRTPLWFNHSVRTQISYVTGDDPGVRIESPQGKGIFSLLQNFQTVSGAHPASYSMGICVLSRGVKRLGFEVDHSHPSSAGVKTGWSYTSTPNHKLSWCHQDQPCTLQTASILAS